VYQFITYIPSAANALGALSGDSWNLELESTGEPACFRKFDHFSVEPALPDPASLVTVEQRPHPLPPPGPSAASCASLGAKPWAVGTPLLGPCEGGCRSLRMADYNIGLRLKYEQQCPDCGQSNFVEDHASGDLVCRVRKYPELEGPLLSVQKYGSWNIVITW
jgi:ribosomal protein S27AE